MATVLEALKGINAYPIPMRSIVDAAKYRGLVITDEATQEKMRSAAFKLAKADLLLWLSSAPDVSQGGQTYSFTDEQRVQFRNRANALYRECDDSGQTKSIYGYKGSKL